MDPQLATLHVNGDRVAITHGRDRAAYSSFGSNVPYAQSSGSARKASVRNQRHRFRQLCAGDRRGNTEHFAHSRTAAWPFIANDDHVSCLNRAIFHGRKGLFFRIEHACWTFEEKFIVSREFHYAAFGGEVSLQDHR